MTAGCSYGRRMFFFDFASGQFEYHKNDMGERLTEYQLEAVAEVLCRAGFYRKEGFLSRLTDVIVEKKLVWIMKAKNKAELKEISGPSLPEYYGGKFRAKGRYHVEEEELILWSMASLRAPLNQEGYHRYGELFCKFFPEEGKEIFGDEKKMLRTAAESEDEK